MESNRLKKKKKKELCSMLFDDRYYGEKHRRVKGSAGKRETLNRVIRENDIGKRVEGVKK